MQRVPHPWHRCKARLCFKRVLRFQPTWQAIWNAPRLRHRCKAQLGLKEAVLFQLSRPQCRHKARLHWKAAAPLFQLSRQATRLLQQETLRLGPLSASRLRQSLLPRPANARHQGTAICHRMHRLPRYGRNFPQVLLHIKCYHDWIDAARTRTSAPQWGHLHSI
jgi:hypothetical protein